MVAINFPKNTGMKFLRKKANGSALISEGMLRLNKLINGSFREGNIVILYSGRCGATVLGHQLHQHPEIGWGREFFDQVSKKYGHYAWIPDLPLKILEKAMYRRRCRFYGFETKALEGEHPHCKNSTTSDYVHALMDLGFDHFVILRRNNYLKQALSSAIARQRKRWISRLDEPLALERVSIDLNRFRYGDDCKPLLQHFENLTRYYHELDSLLKDQRVLRLVYEDDIEKYPADAYRQVCKFVGVEPVAVDLNLKKIDPFPMIESLSNLEEVAAALSNTKYEWMLEE